MNKIHPILTCDVCCTKGIIRKCPLDKCDYKMCMSCRNRYDGILCPLCRRELPVSNTKCICKQFNTYVLKKYIRDLFILFCNMDTSQPIRNYTDILIIFLKFILFILKLFFFITFMFACRAISELDMHCKLLDSCQQSFLCDNAFIFILLCIYGFVLLCIYTILILFSLYVFFILINQTRCIDF